MNDILMIFLVLLILAIAIRFIVLVLKTDGLIDSFKRLILVYSKAFKDTITYPIRFKILKYRCNKIIKLCHIGYLSRYEARTICKRLMDRHNEKYFKNYMNFDKYVDKN